MKKSLLFLICLAFAAFARADNIIIVQPSGAGGGNPDYTAYAGCQGAWLFDDALTDSSGEGNTLSTGGNPSYSVDIPGGYAGKSIDFDGDDYVYRTDANLSADFPAKVQKEDFSGCFWVDRDQADATEVLTSKGSSGQAFDIYATYSSSSWNEIVLRIYDSGADTDSGLVIDPLAASWTHFCWSFDGSATTLESWIDNVKQDNITYTNVNNVRNDPADYAFTIGAANSAAQPITGRIDEYIIFDETLDDVATGMSDANDSATVSNIYNYGIDGNQ